MTHVSSPDVPDQPKKQPKKEKEQEYLAGWQRARAELVNFRKNMAEQSVAERDRLKQDVIEPLMQLADNMQALVVHCPPDLATNGWVQGVLHVARQFDQVLADYGVTLIDQADVPFDPRWHEAVESSGDKTEGEEKVMAIVQRGYRIGDRVLRPAKVTISQ